MADKLTPMFEENGATIPAEIRISCGFPAGTRGVSSKNRAIGQCWSAECSADKHHEVFISPVLSDPVRVADVLVHELVHAAVGNKAGHKGPFKRLAVRLGLTGKMTATVATPELAQRLNVLCSEVGPYPHAALDPMTAGGRKKQGTRLIKVVCPECGYTVRTTRQWIETGLPVCGPCETPMEEAK
jgi:hypothetical protein